MTAMDESAEVATKHPGFKVTKMTVGYELALARDYQKVAVSCSMEVELSEGEKAGEAFTKAKNWLRGRVHNEANDVLDAIAPKH